MELVQWCDGKLAVHHMYYDNVALAEQLGLLREVQPPDPGSSVETIAHIDSGGHTDRSRRTHHCLKAQVSDGNRQSRRILQAADRERSGRSPIDVAVNRPLTVDRRSA